MKHIMIDIETLGLSADAVVTEIGACVFSSEGVSDEKHFHEFLSPALQINNGRTVDEGTLAFRAKETEATLYESMTNGISALHTVHYFREWYCSNFSRTEEPPFIWCNGTDFDAAILEDLFRQYGGVVEPWKYNHFRDLRTLRTAAELLGIKVEKRKNDHNALNDALNQAAEAAEILAAMEEMKR